MWGCHHESERDGKGKGGTKAGDRKKRERQQNVTQTCPIWPFRLTRLPFPTPYSRNRNRLNKASSRRSFSLSCYPFLPHAQTPDDAPNGILLLLSLNICADICARIQRSPAQSRARAQAMRKSGGAWHRTASDQVWPHFRHFPFFFSHYITCLDLLFSLIHHQNPLDCLALWLWIPSYSCSPVPVQFLT